MNNVYLGLGSNLGNKSANIKSAADFFLWDKRFENVASSSLYLTKPYGKREQEDFLNSVIKFETKLSLDVLFTVTKELERRIGRHKREVWGPREIDIDILLFGDLIHEDENLSVPHKDLLNRDFVIVPLLEIDSEIIHPIEKKKINSFLSLLKDKYIIDKINFNFEEGNLGG